MQLNYLAMIECNRTTLVDAPGLGRLDTGALTLPNETDLHLGDHAEHRQDHLADRPLRRNRWFQHSEMRTLAFQLVDEVEDVTGAAAEAVKLVHDQGVSGPDEVDDVLQLGAAIARPARHLLLADELAASLLELGNLDVVRLGAGRHARVANERIWHGSSPP